MLFLHARGLVTAFDEILHREFRERLADHLPTRVLPVSTMLKRIWASLAAFRSHGLRSAPLLFMPDEQRPGDGARELLRRLERGNDQIGHHLMAKRLLAL